MRKFLCTLAALFLLNLSVLADNTLQPIDNIVGHYKNKINVVFSDIDGTLLPKGLAKGEVSDSAKQAAKKLRDANIPLILTTGRSYAETKSIAKKLGNKKAYLITLQGTEVIDPKGKVIYKDCMNSKDTKKIINSLEAFIKLNNLDSKIYFYLNGTLYSTKKFNMPYAWDKLVVIKSYESLGDFTPTKIGVYEKEHKKLELIKSYLKTNFPDYLVYLSTECFCEITNLTETKGNGVKQVAKLMNVDLKNSAVFGDAENDSSMLSVVKKSEGLAVAVKNAMPGLNKNANYETKSVYDGGVNYAIDKILENNALLDKGKK